MADSCPPCCPSTRNPLMAPNPTASSDKGSMKTVAGGQECYVTGSPSSKFGILAAAGAGGFGSGKTRAVLDELAERLGAYGVMPRLHSPPLEGGEQGDGLPNNFDFEKRFKEVNPWMMTFPWDVTGPKVEKALAHFKEMGVEKVAGIGFCWGGWCMLKTVNLADSSLVCAVVFHPACHLEQMFKGDTLGLCATAKAPMLLMPAKDDLAIKMKGSSLYDPENGTIVQALKKSQPKSAAIPFPDMLHGWVSNGDMKDEKVARDSKIALDEATKYMGQFLGGAKM